MWIILLIVIECCLHELFIKTIFTAENIAEKYDISREQQDKYALESQKRTAEAQKNGVFKDEITPVEVKIRRNTVVFDVDEYPKHDTSLESLSALKPVFKTVRCKRDQFCYYFNTIPNLYFL